MTVGTPEPVLPLPPGVPSAPFRLRSRRGGLLLGGFTAAHFSHHVTNSLLNPLLPLIRDAFALSYTQSGLAVSAFSLAVGLANAPLGYLADRIGHRLVLVAGLLLLGLVSVALSLVGSYVELLLLLVALGIVSGTYHAPAATLLARSFPAGVRGAALGLHITGGHFSFFAAPAVAGYLAVATGTWRTPYMWFALAPIALGVVIWFLAPRDHVRPARGGLQPFRDVLAVIRLIGPLVGISVIFQVGFAAVLAFMALYFVDARGIDPAQAAILFAFPQLAGMLGAPIGGWVSDRLGRRAVILLGIGTLGPAVYALTIVPNELLLLPLFFIGVAGAIRMAVTEVLVVDTAPPERRSTVLGSYYLLSQEVGGVAAPVFGVAAGMVGIDSAFSGLGLLLVTLSVAGVLVGRRL